MKRYPLWLLPMLSAAAYAGLDKQADFNPSAVAIYAQFAASPSDAVLEYMRAELGAIMAPLDLQFEWRSLDEASGRQVAAEVLVVRFRGACQVNVLPPLPQKTGPLGWTHIANGQILPFTDVDCDRIRDMLATPLAIASPGERARLLGRAVGRVIAHELYHFLCNTTRHGSHGIAKPSYSAGDLTSAHLMFDQAGLDLVREHRLRLLTEPAHGSP